ncbi:hypothetical protein Pint_31676 [Pistacia integerrima]|uniref:Uncharacterized protein n=1 Tax=Pistacia integerrima TaxID=434235 RepID=A0ACC0XS10_9ROSI|nr:hypothetical protein Pint_31676 [Pistacia integerrima]
MMGCICCKPSTIKDSKESPRERLSSKVSSDLRVSRATSSRREDAYQNFDRKREKMEYVVAQHHPRGWVIFPKLQKVSGGGDGVAAGCDGWRGDQGMVYVLIPIHCISFLLLLMVQHFVVGQLRGISDKVHNGELKLFLEVEHGLDLQPIAPPDKTEEDILLFFKLYDPEKEELRYVGRLFVKSTGKLIEYLAKLNEMAGYAPDKEIALYEVCFPLLIFHEKS